MAPIINGYWGRVTSTIDWCEANYEITIYVAEFWNTVSSILGIMLPPLYALWLRQQNDAKIVKNCWWQLCLVGLGSTLFHGTLKYRMQLLDEVPMMTLVLTILYCQICVLYRNINRKLLKIFILTYFLTAIGSYIVQKTPSIFQVLFTLTLFSTFALNFRINKVKKGKSNLPLLTVSLFAVALTVWLIDYNFCNRLVAVRKEIGSLAPLAQFHSLWHMFSGASAFIIIDFVRIFVSKSKKR